MFAIIICTYMIYELHVTAITEHNIHDISK